MDWLHDWVLGFLSLLFSDLRLLRMKPVFLKPGGITAGERPGLLGPFVILGRVRGAGVCPHMVPRQDTFTAAARSLGSVGRWAHLPSTEGLCGEAQGCIEGRRVLGGLRLEEQ